MQGSSLIALIALEYYYVELATTLVLNRPRPTVSSGVPVSTVQTSKVIQVSLLGAHDCPICQPETSDRPRALEIQFNRP